MVKLNLQTQVDFLKDMYHKDLRKGMFLKEVNPMPEAIHLMEAKVREEFHRAMHLMGLLIHSYLKEAKHLKRENFHRDMHLNKAKAFHQTEASHLQGLHKDIRPKEVKDQPEDIYLKEAKDNSQSWAGFHKDIHLKEVKVNYPLPEDTHLKEVKVKYPPPGDTHLKDIHQLREDLYKDIRLKEDKHPLPEAIYLREVKDKRR